MQGASRILFTLARHRLLPAVFAELRGDRRMPRAAVLAVVVACITSGLASLALFAIQVLSAAAVRLSRRSVLSGSAAIGVGA